MNFRSSDGPVDSWDRVVVEDWKLTSRETLGSDAGVWLEDPHGRRWLHKSVRVQPNHLDGEDWAEVATTAVAASLGIPAAKTRLSTRDGVNGSISLQINNPGTHDFVEGALFLLDILNVDVSDRPACKGPKQVRAGHSLDNIKQALQNVDPPERFGGPTHFTGFDVFAGYICLDMLVANRDRHEQNWAVLEPRLIGRNLQLAPSYDHGGAFGYNLQPAKRLELLHDAAKLRRWAGKGTAHRLHHTRPPGPTSLLDAALCALSMASPDAKTYWSDRIDGFDVGSFSTELPLAIPQSGGTSPPQMSDPVPTMITRLLEVNRRRFCDAIAQH